MNWIDDDTAPTELIGNNVLPCSGRWFEYSVDEWLRILHLGDMNACMLRDPRFRKYTKGERMFT